MIYILGVKFLHKFKDLYIKQYMIKETINPSNAHQVTITKKNISNLQTNLIKSYNKYHKNGIQYHIIQNT